MSSVNEPHKGGKSVEARNRFVCRTIEPIVIFRVLIVVILGCRRTASAQPGLAARFPDPQRVLTDFSDDPSRYAALSVLYNALGAVKSPPGTHDAYEKSTAYFRAMGQVESKYEAPGSGPQAANDFDAGWRRLTGDASFRRGVLEKYRLGDLPVARPGPAAAPGTASNSPARASVDSPAILLPALPYWIGTLVVMWFLPKLVIRVTGKLRSSPTPEPGMEFSVDPTQLPEALRSFQILGEPINLQIASGQVVEEKTWSETHVSASSTPSTPYVHGHTTISSSTVTKDRIWVRLLDGRETAWTFTGGFETRVGHIITGIWRIYDNRGTEMLAAYNHSTGNLRTGDSAGIDYKYKIRIFLPLVITAIAGTVGSFPGTVQVMPILLDFANTARGVNQQSAAVFTALCTSFFFAVIIALAFSAMAAAGVLADRNRVWARVYKPAIARFLNQSTAALAQRFNKA